MTKDDKGRIRLKDFFQEFKDGDRVVLKADPGYQRGMYHTRFHGKSGVIKGKQGECYKVIINDGALSKTLLTHPVHLKKV